MRHTVYRFFGKDGALLYVGVTNRFSERLSRHRRTQAWWGEVDAARTTTRSYGDRRAALLIETAAILEENPRYNIAEGGGGRRPRGDLSPGRADTLRECRQCAEDAQAAYRAEVLAALAAGGSFAWVAEVTGLSTNTLQRWKRESA